MLGADAHDVGKWLHGMGSFPQIWLESYKCVWQGIPLALCIEAGGAVLKEQCSAAPSNKGVRCLAGGGGIMTMLVSSM